jgi:hypothetical protein
MRTLPAECENLFAAEKADLASVRAESRGVLAAHLEGARRAMTTAVHAASSAAVYSNLRADCARDLAARASRTP